MTCIRKKTGWILVTNQRIYTTIIYPILTGPSAASWFGSKKKAFMIERSFCLHPIMVNNSGNTAPVSTGIPSTKKKFASP